MANAFFQFKQFTVQQDACAMKVCTDACLFGAWCANELQEDVLHGQTLLDIGTGTGLLSLMVRQKNELYIDAVEIEQAAARQAQQNVQDSPWPNAIEVVHSDILTMAFSKRYDYIISNPPFYEKEWQSHDHKRNTALHSSQLTLSSLLLLISKQLKQRGTFFLLLPYKRLSEAKELMNQNSLWTYKEIHIQQTEQHRPFRVLLKGGLRQQENEINTIMITANNQQYTPEFTRLLKDYYLYL